MSEQEIIWRGSERDLSAMVNVDDELRVRHCDKGWYWNIDFNDKLYFRYNEFWNTAEEAQKEAIAALSILKQSLIKK